MCKMRATEGFTIWLTGIPASGKTTLAKNITDSFHQIVLIDSEEAINIITPSSSFSQKERLCVYNGLIYSSFCLNKCGINVIIAATGNYRRFSEHARNNINNFIEVYINCSVETCMQRDPKGFYKKAKNESLKGNNILNPKLAFEKSYITDLLQALVIEGHKIKAIPIHGGWLELDTLHDYEIYNQNNICLVNGIGKVLVRD